MSKETRLLLAAILLLVGGVLAIGIPPGRCPMGGRLDRKADGGYWCHVSDVGYSASSLVPLKIGLAVVAVGSAALVAAPVVVHRRG